MATETFKNNNKNIQISIVEASVKYRDKYEERNTSLNKYNILYIYI